METVYTVSDGRRRPCTKLYIPFPGPFHGHGHGLVHALVGLVVHGHVLVGLVVHGHVHVHGGLGRASTRTTSQMPYIFVLIDFWYRLGY